MINHGHGCLLGPLQDKHVDYYRKNRNNLLIRRWCRQTGLISEADQQKWFKRQNDDPTIQMFEVYPDDVDGGVPWGVCGLTSIDLHARKAEFSLWIAPDKHRKGMAKKALKTLFSYGFDELGLNVIWGETFEDNPAKFLFKKLGMHVEGVRRDFYFKNGKHTDAILFSLKDHEWTR